MERTVTSVLALVTTLLMVTTDTNAFTSTTCPKWTPGAQIVSIAHETDCTKYYVCSNGEKLLRECPFSDAKGHKLYFNPVYEVCDWPFNVDCKQPFARALIMTDDDMTGVDITDVDMTDVDMIDVDMATIPTECPKVDPANYTVQLPHETDCTKFYKCAGGKKFLMSCPIFNTNGDRLYYNATLQVCDWPSNVDCEPSLLRTPVMALNAIPTECPNVDPFDHTIQLAHETYCTKFYKCSGGKKFLMDCPVYDKYGNRLYFNPALQLCDYPSNVHCTLPLPRAFDLMDKVKIPTKCPKVDPIDHTIQLAHETYCTKFYKCSAGKKFVMDCPVYDDEGHRLYFNPALQQCDWPSNVDCKLPHSER